jgi:hypothetical protein
MEGLMEEKDLSLAVVFKTNLLQPEDLEFLKKHEADFGQRLRTWSLRRSQFVMETSVLRDDEHPTPDSKYWQAIVEQSVQLKEMLKEIFEYQKSKLRKEMVSCDIEELEEKLKADLKDYQRKKTDAEVAIKRIELQELDLASMDLLKDIHERMRELKAWENIIQKLLPELKHGTEDFSACHPEKYSLAYQRKMQMLGMMDKSGQLSTIAHHESFSKHPAVQGKVSSPDGKVIDFHTGDRSPFHGG